MSQKLKDYISYKDDNDKVISGYFELVDITVNYVLFRTGKNELLIPFHRILKIKREVT